MNLPHYDIEDIQGNPTFVGNRVVVNSLINASQGYKSWGRFFYGSYDSFLSLKSSKEQLINYSINGYRNTPDLLKIGRTSVRCDSDTTTPLKQLRKFSIIGAILSDLANKAYCVAVFYSTHDLKGI